MTDLAVHDVYAVKYAERDAVRSEHFIGGADPHDAPMPMDYFVWVVRGGDRTWVVDTGFDQGDADARGRRLLRTSAEAVALVGVDAGAVEDVVITHLHYDHVGGFQHFPNARFHLQDAEMAFATGRHMTTPLFAHGFTPAHVTAMVERVFARRVVFHDGDAVLAPGLSVHHVGGHTAGLQVVRVHTSVGWIVLASDSSHYYENMQRCRPFPVVFDVGAMVQGYARLRELADDPRCIVPGHDPLVLRRYPPAGDGLAGTAVRLDAVPSDA